MQYPSTPHRGGLIGPDRAVPDRSRGLVIAPADRSSEPSPTHPPAISAVRLTGRPTGMSGREPGWDPRWELPWNEPLPKGCLAAADYRRRATLFPGWRELLVARLGLRPGDTVLDVGCGPGLNLAALRDAVGSTGTVSAVEASAQLLAVAATRVTHRAAPSQPLQGLLFSSVPSLPSSSSAHARIWGSMRSSTYSRLWRRVRSGMLISGS